MSAPKLKEEVEKIRSFGWDTKSVSSYLDVKEGTLHDVLHRSSKAESISKSKTKSIRIIYFRIFLERIKSKGIDPNLNLVESIPVMGERSFSTFIKEHYSDREDLVTHIINESVEKFFSNRLNTDYVALFKEKFGGIINEKTLTEAAINDPQLLADFITQGKIKNYTKALATSKLGLSHNDIYIGLLKTLTRDESALVREGAYKALTEYFLEDEKKYSYLFEEFKTALQIENGEGVRKQIASLLELMEMYQ